MRKCIIMTFCITVLLLSACASNPEIALQNLTCSTCPKLNMTAVDNLQAQLGSLKDQMLIMNATQNQASAWCLNQSGPVKSDIMMELTAKQTEALEAEATRIVKESCWPNMVYLKKDLNNEEHRRINIGKEVTQVLVKSIERQEVTTKIDLLAPGKRLEEREIVSIVTGGMVKCGEMIKWDAQDFEGWMYDS